VTRYAILHAGRYVAGIWPHVVVWGDTDYTALTWPTMTEAILEAETRQIPGAIVAVER